MSLPTPTLPTARLTLRPFDDADADDLFALHSNGYVLRYWDAPPACLAGAGGQPHDHVRAGAAPQARHVRADEVDLAHGGAHVVHGRDPGPAGPAGAPSADTSRRRAQSGRDRRLDVKPHGHIMVP